MRSTVQSVTGPIRTADLGFTLVHEHLRTRREAVYTQFPHLYDDEAGFRTAVARVSDVRSKGVRTICDPTVMGLGRDVAFLRRVAEATGMQIIAATGYTRSTNCPRTLRVGQLITWPMCSFMN